MVKMILPGSKRRREPPGMLEGQQKKRKKMDRLVKLECGKILKSLMGHKFGWCFSEPVDPVALKIPDYFSIISHPMDLGTIKQKLEDNSYVDAEEVAADIRLTFSNSIQYNPPDNDVHLIAKQLLATFNRSWKLLEAKWEHDLKSMRVDVTVNGRASNTRDTTKNCSTLVPKTLPKESGLVCKTGISSDEKRILRRELAEASTGKMNGCLRDFLRKYGLICSTKEKIEHNLKSLDDKTLYELKKIIKGSNARPAEFMKNFQLGSLEKAVPKGNADRTAPSSVKTKQPLSLITSNCGPCASLGTDPCNTLSNVLSSENLFGQCDGVSKRISEEKGKPTSCTNMSDPDSDGAVSTLDSEHFFSSPGVTTPATNAASEEEWNLLLDAQLSPNKALRAAMLKSRFAETILKAKRQALLERGKVDPSRLQQEIQRLERQQLKEKTKIEAEIKAHIKAKADLQLQRQREREALDKMERTVVLDDNLKWLKDLERFCYCSSGRLYFDLRHGKPLEQLGLFAKRECFEVYEDDEPEMEDGEIPQQHQWLESVRE